MTYEVAPIEDFWRYEDAKIEPIQILVVPNPFKMVATFMLLDRKGEGKIRIKCNQFNKSTKAFKDVIHDPEKLLPDSTLGLTSHIYKSDGSRLPKG